MARRETFPIRREIAVTAEQWERIRRWRFAQAIDSQSEAIRRLIDRGLSTWTPPVPSVTQDDAERG